MLNNNWYCWMFLLIFKTKYKNSTPCSINEEGEKERIIERSLKPSFHERTHSIFKIKFKIFEVVTN